MARSGRSGRPGRRRVVDALGAAVAAGLVFCAVPAVLVLVVGNLTPTRPRSMRGGPTAAMRCASSWWRPGWPGLSAARSWFVASLLRCGRVPWACSGGGFGHRPPGGPDRDRHPDAHQRRRSSRPRLPRQRMPNLRQAPTPPRRRTRSMRRLRPAPKSALRSRIPPISCGPARASGASPTHDRATGRTGLRSPL